MGVNWGVAGSSCQVLSVAVRNVLASLGISEALGQPEVDHVDVMLLFADADEEVVRFDVSVQEMTRVHELNTLQLYKAEEKRLEEHRSEKGTRILSSES